MKWALAILIFPSLVWADCDISSALQSLRPGSQWNLRGNKYSGIEWLDPLHTEPLSSEIDAAIAACNVDDQDRKAKKVLAKATVKDSTMKDKDRLEAIILLLDLDR